MKAKNFDIGDVFCWKNFPLPGDDSKVKDRWFIFLSEYEPIESILDGGPDVLVLLLTTTTQFYHADDKQAGVDYVELFESDGFGFSRDCLLMQSNSFKKISKSVFDAEVAGRKISIEGRLSNEKLSSVWKLICSSSSTIDMEFRKKILIELKAKNIENLVEIKPTKKRKRYK